MGERGREVALVRLHGLTFIGAWMDGGGGRGGLGLAAEWVWERAAFGDG